MTTACSATARRLLSCARRTCCSCRCTIFREGKRAGLIPYKTYEYLATGRPVLAAVPDGDVRDLLAPLEQASVCRPSDVRAMAADIRERATGAREVAVSDRVSPVVRELERRRLVARIAPVFDEVVGTPWPSAVDIEPALASR